MNPSHLFTGEQETKSQAALSSAAVFEYQILRKGNAVINYEFKDSETQSDPGVASDDAEPPKLLIATLFISCPDSEGLQQGQEL